MDEKRRDRVWVNGREIPGARVISMSINWGVWEPPAAERVTITERTNEIARDLVKQALGDEQTQENKP